MALITASDLRARVETDLTDAALGDVIDAEAALVVKRYGPDYAGGAGGDQTLQYDLSSPSDEVWLPRIAQTLTSVDEIRTDGSTISRTVDTDVGLWRDGRSVRVLGLAGWSTRRVEVVFTPADDDAERKQVLVDLCKLSLVYNGLSSMRVPGVTMNSLDYERERERILRRLATPYAGIA